ncbi:hypothetical protein OAC51_01525 [Flavobacteriaceae bacterium]|nr:hypothetical protein [Flavobacteriaceae bacterium]
MTIEHLAIWTKDIEEMKIFYLEFFEVMRMKNTLILQKISTPIFFRLQAELELN